MASASCIRELNVLDNLDVGANVFLGREPRRFGLVDRRKIAADTRPLLDMLGLEINPETPLSELSIGQQQMIEIAKALSKQARIIIMDEAHLQPDPDRDRAAP